MQLPPAAPTSPIGNSTGTSTHADPAAVIGEWTDESDSVYVIARDGQAGAKIVSAHSHDGEAKTNLESGWNEDGNFWFKYYLKSTDVTVTIVFADLDRDHVTYEWNNGETDGTDEMTRNGGNTADADAADADYDDDLNGIDDE